MFDGVHCRDCKPPLLVFQATVEAAIAEHEKLILSSIDSFLHNRARKHSKASASSAVDTFRDILYIPPTAARCSTNRRSYTQNRIPD
ncbi:hypothetical protein Moror_17038 [Moniliophthora roreri MCA 2997]|uniref:Uncharacterized protein n=1 Tax=Moniliophthora roreri (strain MCA 2997) TaxID=1381753 RepID=V2X7U0_MONRO|nr:hypothetical protein Moror_17038 [Moniliophthora roreri MCA 2997]